MRTLYAKWKHRFFVILQSPYLVPIIIVLFANLFLLSVLLVRDNVLAIRQRVRTDFVQHELLLARQEAHRLNALLRQVSADLAMVGQVIEREQDPPGPSWTHDVFMPQRENGVVQVGFSGGGQSGGDYHVRLDPVHAPERYAPRSTDTGVLLIERNLAGEREAMFLVRPPSAEKGAGAGLYAVVNLSLLLARSDRSLFTNRPGHLWVVGMGGTLLYHSRGGETGKRAAVAFSTLGQPVEVDTLLRRLDRALLSGKAGSFEYGSPYHHTVAEGTSEPTIAVHVPLASSLIEESPYALLIHAIPRSAILEGVEGLYRRLYFAQGFVLVGLFLVGLLVASYQQRLSGRLRGIIREQDQILASVLSNSVDAIIVVDEENQIQMWNRGAALIFGYPPEEMLGQSLTLLLPPDKHAETEFASMDREMAEHGYVREYITQRQTRDGERITVDISRTPFTYPDGTSGVTEVIKDVTEKTAVDQRMYSAEKLASIGLLASGVAHEINNPLTIILGFTDLLKERFEPESQEAQDLEMIEFNARAAQKIVQDLLGFSRGGEGRVNEVDTSASLRKLIAFIETTRLAKKVELTTEIEMDLPPVYCDHREIQQVILNLVNNSVAAMESGEGRVHIWARQLSDDWVEIGVEDNGCGIPAEIQPRIFDPFFTTKDVDEGTGLGLSLSYGIVKKWGGELTFSSTAIQESSDGHHGTTFRVHLPVHPSDFNPETTA